MTSRFEPRDTASASAALDRLAKLLGATVRGGYIAHHSLMSVQDGRTWKCGGAPFYEYLRAVR